MTRSELEQAVRDEVKNLHDFIAGWFRGELENGERTFDRGFTTRLGSTFRNIQPNGGVLTRDDIIGGIRSAHGSNPDFRISIHDVSLRDTYDDDRLLLATYLERQSGAKNTIPADNDRISTVLMRRGDGGKIIWLHLHETARI
jgi:hypothetical protein